MKHKLKHFIIGMLAGDIILLLLGLDATLSFLLTGFFIVLYFLIAVFGE